MRRKIAALIVIALIVLIVGVSVFQGVLTSPTSETPHQYAVKVAFPNVQFRDPDGVYNAGDRSDRLFVVEQAGVIKVFENNESVNAANIFLNISDRVTSGGELGLLGLAFPRQFNESGFFYVYYTTDDPLRSVVSRFSVSQTDKNQADVNSEKVLLQVEQPFPNHNGGQISFGPDGYLYIGLGDGGGAGDPLGNGQNRSTLLGKILRIDVNSASGSLNYSIPRDNPFVGNNQGFREEIYAYGLRNPWRFSFDSVTGRLWVGDVGQDRIEEIDIVKSGGNYGWNIMEGSLCYSPPSGCNQTGLALPIWEYIHATGYSVTGGFVYRGAAFPELEGAYVFGDYGSGRIWALRYDGMNSTNSELAATGVHITSFGLDQKDELYFCASDGNVYRLQRSTT
ncbi:MAG: PQQ-dependent sugar dehydrogenase [Halobacteriota archaeon]